MPDHLYLSAWLHEYDEDNMLQHWQRVIEAFPLSSSGPGIRSVSIFPFNWSETPVFERSFGAGATAEDVISLAQEFSHDDYAYEVEATWELWIPTFDEVREDEIDGDMEDLEPTQIQGWSLKPVQVSIACTGPNFDPESLEDRAHIQINFGLDAPFLPMQAGGAEDELEFGDDEADVRARQNLKQLIDFVHRLDESVPIERRLLWCESGESLADKILTAWNEHI